MRLFRVVVPVTDIDAATRFYEQLLDLAGTRVWSNRHYLDCEGTILALVQLPADDPDHDDPRPNPEPIYLAVDDLEAGHRRAVAMAARVDDPIALRPWGERSCYVRDPDGNRICLVDRTTVFTG